MTTIAARYLAARDEKNAVDDALSSAIEGSGLLDFCPEEDDDMTWDGDSYDGSLELFVPKQVRVTELGAFVLSLGFDKVWVHQHTGRRPAGCCSDPGHLFICDRLKRLYEEQRARREAAAGASP